LRLVCASTQTVWRDSLKKKQKGFWNYIHCVRSEFFVKSDNLMCDVKCGWTKVTSNESNTKSWKGKIIRSWDKIKKNIKFINFFNSNEKGYSRKIKFKINWAKTRTDDLMLDAQRSITAGRLKFSSHFNF
jgi:hypothetical protein